MAELFVKSGNFGIILNHIGQTKIKNMTTQKDVNALSRVIIGYAIEVHKELGPGLLKSIYEKCLAHLLIQNGYTVIGQQSVPLNFKGLDLTCELRFDLLVNDLVVVELKQSTRYCQFMRLKSCHT